MNIGSSLKFLRTRAKKTQKEVADYLGIKINTYSQYETSHRKPSLEALNRLASFYGVDPGGFFGDGDKGFSFSSNVDYQASSLDELFEQMVDSCMDNYEFAIGKDNVDDDEFIYRLLKAHYNIRKDDLPNMSFEEYLNYLKERSIEKDKE